MITPGRALLATLAGFVMVAAALTWRFGPWGLLGSGLALIVVALLLAPVKERRGEPAEPATPPVT